MVTVIHSLFLGELRSQSSQQPLFWGCQLFFAVIRERLGAVWGAEVEGCRISQELQKTVISKVIIKCPVDMAWVCLHLKQGFFI